MKYTIDTLKYFIGDVIVYEDKEYEINMLDFDSNYSYGIQCNNGMIWLSNEDIERSVSI